MRISLLLCEKLVVCAESCFSPREKLSTRKSNLNSGFWKVSPKSFWPARRCSRKRARLSWRKFKSSARVMDYSMARNLWLAMAIEVLSLTVINSALKLNNLTDFQLPLRIPPEDHTVSYIWPCFSVLLALNLHFVKPTFPGWEFRVGMALPDCFCPIPNRT